MFPGGGIFFWWQAGVVAALAERGYDFSNSRSIGVSAGALAATLATCGADMNEAFDLAAAASINLFDRGPWALQGVWGGIIRQWLDDLLPEDAAERCSSRVHILTKEAPCLHTRVISTYADRDDLIHANMASVHIPCAPRTARTHTRARAHTAAPTTHEPGRSPASTFTRPRARRLFLDGQLTARFRGGEYVDGSLSLESSESMMRRLLIPDTDSEPHPGRVMVIESSRDARMRSRFSKAGDFVRLSSVDAVREMMVWGREYIGCLEAEGSLELLLLRAAGGDG